MIGPGTMADSYGGSTTSAKEIDGRPLRKRARLAREGEIPSNGSLEPTPIA